MKKSVDKQKHLWYNSLVSKTRPKQITKKKENTMFNIFKKKATVKYIIVANYENHLCYTEQKKWDVLARVGYDAQIIEIK